ncbi:MAG TPA: SBBP repeat-containing protein, partial [Rhodanobacteraceae bacterium]
MLSLVTFVAVVQSAHSAPAAPNSRDDSRIQQQFAQLPLRFEENRGQFDRSVRYAARGTGQTLYLTSTGPAFVLRGNKDERPSLGRIAFDGASADPAIIGEGQLDSTTQYFVGNGPKNWRLDIASFGRVRYRNIYPGVDVVYYAKGRELEYDLVLAPEANPELVGLRFEGFDTIGIDRGGGLVLRSATGDLRQKRPVAYQTVDGRRCLVSARYVRRGRSRIGLALGDYDRDKPLVIDPLVLFYAGYLGGNTTDQAFALAVDSAGNAYVAGSTESLNFPVVNAVQPALKGTTDIFISKINTAGNALLYSTYLG